MRLLVVFTILCVSIALPLSLSAAPTVTPDPAEQIKIALLKGDLVSLEAQLANSPSLQAQSLDFLAAYSLQNYDKQPELVTKLLALLAKYPVAINSGKGISIAKSITILYENIVQNDIISNAVKSPPESTDPKVLTKDR